MLTSTFSRGEAVGDDADMRPRVMPRFLEANREQNTKVVGEFKKLADKKRCSVSQLALAWLLKQGTDIFPIPGTKQLKYLEENSAAVNILLSDEEDAEIKILGDTTEIAGGTTPPQFASHVYRNTKEASS
jgi:aryl-alcohol dehydrogenase-like predicted oxidoreductase